jgi:hypothetical protein
MAEGQLPFPPIPDTVPGNPVHMINLLKIDPSKEYLRDSLFYLMFKSSLLFDDLPTASAYRKYLSLRHESYPSMYTRTGERLLSDGIYIPGVFFFFFFFFF